MFLPGGIYGQQNEHGNRYGAYSVIRILSGILHFSIDNLNKMGYYNLVVKICCYGSAGRARPW